jgi:hypothetical protein
MLAARMTGARGENMYRRMKKGDRFGSCGHGRCSSRTKDKTTQRKKIEERLRKERKE